MYIYAETAFHHEGDLKYLKQLIDAARKSGADGVKFQVLTDCDYLISRKHSQYEKLNSFTLPVGDWKKVLEYCEKSGLDIVMMPIDPMAFKLIESFHVRYIDLHSVSFNDESALIAIKQTGIPLILSVGGRKSEEIDEKLNFFSEQLRILMVGFQSFPSKLADVKLEKITFLQENYPSLEVGYADHSAYDDLDAIRSNAWAYILGARIFEKHITLNEGEPRTDYISAVGPEKFREMVEELKYLHDEVLNQPFDSLNELNSQELKYRKRERVIVAKKSLPQGELLQEGHLTLKMTDADGGMTNKEKLIGRKLTQSLEQGDIINEKTVL